MARTTEQYDTADQFDWSYIQTSYRKGRVSETYTLYDDGSEGVQSFDRGALISETRTDNPADGTTNLWSEITTTYDANGDPETAQTVYDNGTVQDDLYDAL